MSRRLKAKLAVAGFFLTEMFRKKKKSGRLFRMDGRVILHVDMDAFFAAIEQHDRPELRGKPIIVGAPPDRRGVVSTCSYEARKFGVHSALPSRTAARLCPTGIFLPVRMDRYREISRQIMALFERFTPHIQPLSCDEAFLDVTGAQRLFGSGPEIAQKIKDAVCQETGLTCSVGVAPNLFLAKIASDLEKPDGLTVVPFSEEEIPHFLAPMPIQRMWGAGRKTQALLQKHNLHTFGDLQKVDPDKLAEWIGPTAASAFYRRAFGRDERSVETDTAEKSISNEVTFGEDLENPSDVEAALMDLADKVGGRLRKAGFYASTAQIKIRWRGFSTITRQQRIDPPCCDDFTLRESAMELLRKEGVHSPVRLIGFGVSGLRTTPNTPQMDLFQSPDSKRSGKREALSRAVDAVREKFGRKSLRRGSTLNPSEE
jgi:nucleotidyltransferase/DNA polymerase involved in DNA repair